MSEGRTDSRKPGETKPGTARLSAAAIGSALELQRTIAEATGRWLRVGEILLLRGDVSTDTLAELRGTALFPMLGSTLPEAELLGEIALRKGFVKPEQFIACLEAQSAERREKRGHKLIGTLLVDRGYMKLKQLQACEEEFRRDLRLHNDEARRARDAGAAEGGGPAKPALTPIDAQYVRAARAGELPQEEIVSSLDAWKSLGKHLDRKVALWEYLVARGIVSIETHKRMLDKSCNVKTPAHGGWMLGGIIVELGYASANDVAAALEQRTAEGASARRLGDILLDRQLLTQAELQESLRIQAQRRLQSVRASVVGRVQASGVGRRAAWAALGLAVVFAAGFALGGLRTSLAYRTLADEGAPAPMRIAAVERLLARAGRDADPAIIAVAKDRRAPAEVRAACLAALAPSVLPEASEAIAAGLADEAPAVRAGACWAAGERDERVEEAALRACLADKDAALSLAAARALASCGEADGREVLVQALEKASPPEQIRLAGMLSIPEERVRRGVVASLERLSGFRFGEDVERWHAWLALQPAADEVLGRHRGAEVAARLGRLLESPRIASRFTAARGLAHLGDARGARLLARALGRDDALRAAVRKEREIELDRLAPELQSLLELLTGEKHGADADAWQKAIDHLERRAGGLAGIAPAAAASAGPGARSGP